MTVDPTAALRATYATAIGGGQASPWREAFAEVPRHRFVPAYFRQDGHGAWQRVTEHDDGCLETVYSDVALTTQVDAHGIPSSSSSEPSIMLTMLEALSAEQGHTVFELGTGTGYNAALLAHRLGAENVTTVDVDPELVRLARHRLSMHGAAPHVVAGDGALGCREWAPFDRIIATAAIRAVYPALLEQAAPGAVIVAPIGFGIARVTVSALGHAGGRFLPAPALFMPRRTRAQAPAFEALRGQDPESTSVPVADVLERMAFPLSLALPGYTSCTWRDSQGAVTAVGLCTEDGSTVTADTSGQVRQTGARRLWETVEKLAVTFPGGRPALDDFGVTITPEEQRVWYGAPAGPAWTLPTG